MCIIIATAPTEVTRFSSLCGGRGAPVSSIKLLITNVGLVSLNGSDGQLNSGLNDEQEMNGSR